MSVFLDEFVGVCLDTFQAFTLIAWILIKIYQILVELRFLIQWFLNINPYFEPFQTLWVITNPFFNFGRALYPKLLGFDLTPMINYKVLMVIESLLDRAAHGVDIYNYHKYFDPADFTTPRIVPIEDINLPDYIDRYPTLPYNN